MNRTDLPPGRHDPGPRVIRILDYMYEATGRNGIARQLVGNLRVGGLSRLWLRSTVLARERTRPDDLTVVIGVRNRSDHRLPLSLRSLREQSWPAERLRIQVVDYGSEPEAARTIARVCAEYGADLVRVEGAGVWSRARCLNVGIRRARTKYLMTSDVDILFSPDYVAQAVEVLRSFPLSVVCAPMLDLPESTGGALERAAAGHEPLPFGEWRERSAPRFGRSWHPSITVAFTVYYRLLRGYDEYYELWGNEDDDLFRRLRRLGLSRRLLAPEEAFYLHQWHPKYEDIPEDVREPAIRRNDDRLRDSHGLLRNGSDWGRGSPGS